MNTKCHNKNFAFNLAFTMRIKATWKWPIIVSGRFSNCVIFEDVNVGVYKLYNKLFDVV